MKIYTKQGDLGRTRLFCNLPVDKFSLRVECFGSLDELNSSLGHALSFIEDNEIKEVIIKIENDLFSIGSELANPESSPKKKDINFLEEKIDTYQNILPELKNFILPNGTKGASALQLARTVCRRAERRICILNKQQILDKEILAYINRLSDLLFVLARLVNYRAGEKEEIWRDTNERIK